MLRDSYVLPVRPSTIHLELELEHESESFSLVEEVLGVILGTFPTGTGGQAAVFAYMRLWDSSKKFSLLCKLAQHIFLLLVTQEP